MIPHGLKGVIKDHDCGHPIARIYYACGYQVVRIYLAECLKDSDEEADTYTEFWIALNPRFGDDASKLQKQPVSDVFQNSVLKTLLNAL